jgi:hypothetical protein
MAHLMADHITPDPKQHILWLPTRTREICGDLLKRYAAAEMLPFRVNNRAHLILMDLG